MTDTTYAVPVVAWNIAADGTGLIAVLPDGRRVPRAEWQQMRVTPAEYYRLAAIKREQHPLNPDAFDPNTGYSTHHADHR